MHDDKPNNKQIREKRALNSKLAEAERRGYRKGVEDAAKAIGEALENPVEQVCCGIGIGVYGGPPECCNNPISLIDGYKAHDAILALLEPKKEGDA